MAQLVTPTSTAEGERRSVLAAYEEKPPLDVVRAVEVRPLAERELPALARRGPVLDRRGENGEIRVDLDGDERIRSLSRRRPRSHLQHGHERLGTPSGEA